MGIDGRCVPERMGGNLTIGHPVGHWVAEQVAGGYYEERSTAIGLEKGGKIVAGVIYESWNGVSVVCHIAISSRITRRFVGVIFDYPFRQLKVQKIIVSVASGNLKSTKLVKHMGFTEEGRIANAHPDGDLVIWTMRQADCRFLGDRYGKDCFSTAGS